MPIKSYKEATDWLFQQFPSYQFIGASAYKPDLGNIRLLCAIFGDPQKNLKFIHVAGTNGKGSTSSMLASILTESGEKVGLFTSPHIIDFRERIRVNGEMIGENKVIQFCNEIRNANLTFEPSFFEITFLMTLMHFNEKKCSICVIETGLGGRLDATNIITPLISVITNIALEHTNFLGNTLEAIAAEKAGIIKNGIPVVIGESTIETKPVFEKIALENNSIIIWCEERAYSNLTPPLLGSYQKKNLRTVLCVLDELKKAGFLITKQTIEKGLNNLYQNTGIFGRMQIVAENPLTIVDVSHNMDGIKKTLETVKEINKGRLHIIYGSSADKNFEEIAQLFPKDTQVNFCKFSNTRSLSEKELNQLSEKFQPTAKVFDSIDKAIPIIQTTVNKEDTILVFGSFFLISDYFHFFSTKHL